jgi:hypothetical protein
MPLTAGIEVDVGSADVADIDNAVARAFLPEVPQGNKPLTPAGLVFSHDQRMIKLLLKAKILVTSMSSWRN